MVIDYVGIILIGGGNVIVRYVLHPGYVYCADGDKHYIGVMELTRLYNITHEFFVEHPSRGFRDSGRDIHLYPQNDGVYGIKTRGKVMFSNTFIKTTVEELQKYFRRNPKKY